MSKSRLSGDVIEKTLCDVFSKLGLECTSVDRLTKLHTKVGGYTPQHLLKPISEKISHIIPKDASTFSISSDHDGKKGIVSDVIIHGEGSTTGISCKRNNFSIKHQRPQALYKQLGLSDMDTQEYKTRYASIMNDFYKMCCENGWVYFKDVPVEKKQELYRNVNTLVMKTIISANAEQKTALLNYLISRDDHGYVLYVGQQDNDVRLYRYNWGDVMQIKSVDWKDIETASTILVETDTIKISLRLHNASSRITKVVSLKYDTSIINIHDIRQEFI
jgi:hypothetical protein